MSDQIHFATDIPRQEIAAFCQRWGVTTFALFGSVLREDFGPESDIDVLIRFPADAHVTLADLIQMGDELEALFSRKVDIIDWEALENSRNYLRRQMIFDSAQVIYAA